MIVDKEYWVNVYDFSMDPKPLPNQLPIEYGKNYLNKDECVKETIDWGWCKQTPIYRIHVKMKEKKVPQYYICSDEFLKNIIGWIDNGMRKV